MLFSLEVHDILKLNGFFLIKFKDKVTTVRHYDKLSVEFYEEYLKKNF